ncbi:MAG: DUF5711 family protein [Clostridiales bacterium]|nr:DUF5711 family protein [Eubacteriales bacterium]MDH7566438.1 DUF5711 family protein [Clostridiales bacterium]
MDLPEEKKSVRPQSVGKMNIFLFFLLVFIILGLAFTVYMKNQNIDYRSINLKDLANRVLHPKSLEVDAGSVTEIRYDLKEHPQFTVYRDLIIKCTGEYIKGLDKKGEEQWSIQYSMNNPMLRTNGSDLLVADKGGKEICLIDGREIKWDKKLENNILTADISPSGYVSVLHEAKGYKGAVTVLNLQGNPFFTRYIGANVPLDAKISPGGKAVVINSIDISGVSANTSLDFTDMQGNVTANRLKQDMILPSMIYFKDGALAAAGDNYLVYLDKDRNEKWFQDYKNGRIYCVGSALDKYLIVACSGDSQQGAAGTSPAEIKIISRTGKQAASYRLDGDVRNMETNGGTIAVNAGKEVYFINTGGNLVKKYTSKSDIDRVCFFNGQEAAVITKSSVEVIKIN